MRAVIRGCGMYVPEKVLTNQDLEKMVDTSDEWITARTGIRQRRIASPEESTSTMAVEAAKQALQRAGLTAADIDMVIVGTATPDYQFPATACLVQDALGIRGGAFDLEAGCTSFMYALSLAASTVATGMNRNVLVIGSEVLSRILDWTDRSTCVLFGDGAGAVVVSPSDAPGLEPQWVLGSDGSGGLSLYLPAGGSKQPASERTVAEGQHFVKMSGPEVFRFATRVVAEAVNQVMDKAHLTVDDIDLCVPHQANNRIIGSAMRRLGIPNDRVFVNIDKYGNTSSASIPIAMCEAEAEGRLRPGDTVVMVGFGAGLTWGAGAIEWQMQPAHLEVEALAASSVTLG